MNTFDSDPLLHPNALFVIACPVCQGEVAATGSLCGRAACCPLCASTFRVPHPPSEAEEPAADQVEQPAAGGLAEDWGDVIGQLAPPEKPAAQEPVLEELALEEHVAEELPPKSTAPPTPTSASLEPIGSDASPAGPPTGVEASASGPPGEDTPATRVEEFSFLEREPLHPDGADLVFQEPVRTVRQGGEVIEIRRLSPEERRRRRFRRTLMMIVIGGSILLLIVILNLPQKERANLRGTSRGGNRNRAHPTARRPVVEVPGGIWL